MTGAELGFLLLGSHLGDFNRPCLTLAQLETLQQKVQRQSGVQPGERYVDFPFLTSLGYEPEMCRRILGLLSQRALAQAYVDRGRRLGYGCITRSSPQYPAVFRELLGAQAPAVLWYRGNPDFLRTATVGLVGCREATPQALEFAATAGYQAARQGFTLVSGGAKGCDRAAQEGCLKQGGRVIEILAQQLPSAGESRENQLELSEDSYDLPFTVSRALSRNMLIHTLGQVILVAQCGSRGGTWSGTIRNLRNGWRPVFFNREDAGSREELGQRGATPIGQEALCDYQKLLYRQLRLY